MKTTFLIGRILLGLFLLQSAIGHFSNSAMLVGFAASKGVPAPEIGVFVSGLLLLIAAASIILGYKPVIGVSAMILFFLPVTFMMHAFWTDTGKMAQMNDMVNFGKNIAILAASLTMVAIPRPWAFSIESLMNREKSAKNISVAIGGAR